MHTLTLYYSHDPMCSFCWAFRPTWAQIKHELSQTGSQIEIINLLGGLAPDSDEPMANAVKEKVSGAWRYIQKNIPGTEFNFDFWKTQQPRRSTYPACRAVIAAKILGTQDEDMILAIQRAYYMEAQNPSNIETLVACAVSIGLSKEQFTKTLMSEQCNADFLNERTLSQNLGINSFPSLVLTRDTSRYNIPIDYINAQSVLKSIDQAAELLLK